MHLKLYKLHLNSINSDKGGRKNQRLLIYKEEKIKLIHCPTSLGKKNTARRVKKRANPRGKEKTNIENHTNIPRTEIMMNIIQKMRKENRTLMKMRKKKDMDEDGFGGKEGTTEDGLDKQDDEGKEEDENRPEEGSGGNKEDIEELFNDVSGGNRDDDEEPIEVNQNDNEWNPEAEGENTETQERKNDVRRKDEEDREKEFEDEMQEDKTSQEYKTKNDDGKTYGEAGNADDEDDDEDDDLEKWENEEETGQSQEEKGRKRYKGGDKRRKRDENDPDDRKKKEDIED
eukprot:TRINITY_DN1463_c0_g1_i6.p1 TRINITY_DN1463_c0_g1~~TRINITY_DN1463_c0_g1_i6.p1  ORF type:complete len:287 (-),score=113.96 TRINITY_DN1463_c0_g1_i6:95-955(-)